MSKNFKELTDKMSVESRERVKSSLKKEVKKTKKPRMKNKTTQCLFGNYRMVITQTFFNGESTGHYILVLMDKKGNLLITGGSDGAKERLTPKDLQALGMAASQVYWEILAERSWS
jgi:hypothetical protein